MLLNQVYNMDCLEGLRLLPDNHIDLTVTSPPYDDLRAYNGYSFDFENIAKELYRVTKQGGIVVWIVGDRTSNGSETGTSFKQALHFKEIGFNLHDTMIWHKPNAMPQLDKTRFTQSFEYMFVLSKGKPKIANPLKVPTKNGGEFLSRGDGNNQNKNKKGGNVVNKYRIAFNVYTLSVGGKNYGHPAIFPEKLAEDHILSWSNPGDTILDPFMGSGTVAKMALLNGRNYLGYEISEEYCNEIIKPRLRELENYESVL
ncbi:TPA: site-specific DNA-methyltransferase [Bacillus cereus]|nr:site-specific DNA-methyltransferase [Bacillus cereus]